MPIQTDGPERFQAYLRELNAVIGHADRQEPLKAYLTGLLLPGERKSVEPMAGRIDPRHVPARHQSMHHFVSTAPWDGDAVLRVARELALRQLERHGPVVAWIVDDTGFPKKGTHSVGVARQYCGQLGKQDNCQVAVSVTLANAVMSIPTSYRLYLPEAWARDRIRRKAAGVPRQVRFQTKWQIALAQIDSLLADQLPLAPIVADAGYGVITKFRDEVAARGLAYAVGTTGEIAVWPDGITPMPPKRKRGKGRPPTLLRRAPGHRPLSVKKLAQGLTADAWQMVQWRDGTKGPMRSRFAAVRVRAAHLDTRRSAQRPVEWLLVEWPSEAKEPTKYWLSNVAESVGIQELVYLVKIRWRIERDYEELKQEVGLGHYEGRGWQGFHHHGVLCIVAYLFLAAERARLSPPEPIAFLKSAQIPKGFRPRGSTSTARAS